MEEHSKQVTLNNGESVLLRPLKPTDEAELVRFFAELPPESTQFLKHDVRDPAVVHGFIERANPEKVWAIVAVTQDARIVGDATLHMTRRGWRRHVGEVRGVVAEDYRRQRLATALVHELVEHASLKGLRRLEAEVLDTQGAAIKVFSRMGFREAARLPQHAMDLRGQLHDLLILTNSVDDLWESMEELISTLDIARVTLV
jgi:RimJ/RimL family protein N-acetyltransferase